EKNFIFLREALDKYSAEIIRHFLISAHYRHPLDYSLESLQKSESALRRLNNCVELLKKYYDATPEIEEESSTGSIDTSDEDSELVDKIKTLELQFTEAMDNDFNTAKAVGSIYSLVSHVNKSVSSSNGVSSYTLANAYKVLLETSQVLGIYTIEGQDKDTGNSAEYLDPLVDLLLEIRQDARDQKDWGTSDKIRDRLKELDIEIQDSREGSSWKIVS
ncbi:cysteine--tRNA ligase, partial [Candidatus Poribacteria bacterium]|nr:cysteine--tRNA ligase [Candidatus Poribacteria bacterium]